MKRRLFNAAALTSLLCLLATAALWVRSYWELDGAFGPLPRGGAFIAATGVGLFSVTFSGPSPAVWTMQREWQIRNIMSADVLYRDNNAVRYLWHFRVSRTSPSSWTLAFPIWAVCLLLVLLPGCWAVHWRQRRVRPGACPACGYDLRGAPGAACPECGASRPAGVT